MRSKFNLSKIQTFEPSGYLTAANITEFQEELTLAVNQSEHHALLVNMARVEFLDSAGLMALASTFRLAQSLGKRFSICCIPPSVQIIFELTQLDRVLDIYKNYEDYQASWRQEQEVAA